MEIVSFEIAKKLKEKGFKEKCLTYYDVEDNVGLLFNMQYYSDYTCPCQYTDLLHSHNTDATVAQPDDSEYCVDAPTIPQVLKWLRKEKNIFVVTFIADDSDIPLTYEIYMGTECLLTHHGEYFTLQEWDKCNLGGIEYVIDNLI